MKINMKPMKILLIAPPVSLCAKERKGLFPRHPPYLLASTASLLERHNFDVKIYDAFMEHVSIAGISKETKEYGPRLIGLAGAEFDREIFVETIAATQKILDDNFPGVPVILIGINNSEALLDIMQKANIYYSILGDPEDCLLEVAECINKEGGTNFTSIPGLVVNHSGKIKINGKKRLSMHLDSLPYPAWHLVDIKKYPSNPHRYYLSHSTYLLMASRGCLWNRCLFCEHISVFNNSPYRVRSPGNVASEIESAIKDYGAKEVQFGDLNFYTDIRWLTELKNILKGKKMSVRWSCLVRVDKVNPESLKLMYDTGCWSIIFGLESSCQNLLDIIKKGCRVNQVEEAIRWCRQVGIETIGSFLIGLPGESPRDVMNSVKFARGIGLDYAQFFITKWTRMPAEFAYYGKFEERKDYSLFNHQGYPFIPNAYRDLNHLKETRRKAYVSFYFSPAIILRHLQKINSFVNFKRAIRALLILIKIVTKR